MTDAAEERGSDLEQTCGGGGAGSETANPYAGVSLIAPAGGGGGGAGGTSRSTAANTASTSDTPTSGFVLGPATNQSLNGGGVRPVSEIPAATRSAARLDYRGPAFLSRSIATVQPECVRLRRLQHHLGGVRPQRAASRSRRDARLAARRRYCGATALAPSSSCLACPHAVADTPGADARAHHRLALKLRYNGNPQALKLIRLERLGSGHDDPEPTESRRRRPPGLSPGLRPVLEWPDPFRHASGNTRPGRGDSGFAEARRG